VAKTDSEHRNPCLREVQYRLFRFPHGGRVPGTV
jgi:hypothetical protein